MKTKVFKTTTALLLTLAFAGSAFAAPVVIHIAGSNGDRATTNTAIPKLLTGTLTYAGTNSDPTKANFATWTGGSFNGTPVTVKVAFIGATGGIAAVAGSLPVKFLPDGATGGSNADPTVGSNPNESAVPDFSLSTNFQSTSPFSGTYLGHSYASLTDQIVAVIGLKWVASKNYPGTNLTTQQAQLLYSAGAAPLALFTGDPADENKTVFATGRNTDAGQRFVALAESGLGVNAVVKHYKPVIVGSGTGVGGFVVGGTVTTHALWPVETFSGVSSQFPGNSGATTGANLAPYLTTVLGPTAYHVGNSSATAGYYISYLTPGDADTIAIPNGAVELKWNGIAYSNQAIQEGQYTFWTYEHVLYVESLSGTPRSFADGLATQILNTDATVAGIYLNTVNVSRTGEGTLVTPNYF